MTALWKSYRYLRENPSLRPQMAQHERRVARLPVTYIPKDRARIECKLKNGDVIGIATKYNGGFCSHVGLAFRAKDGSMRFMHASSDKKKVIVDAPIHQYLARYSKNMAALSRCAGRLLGGVSSRDIPLPCREVLGIVESHD